MRARAERLLRANLSVIAGVAVGAVAGAGVLAMWKADGPTQMQIQSSRTMVEQVRAQTKRAVSTRKYNAVAESWKLTQAALGACGLDVTDMSGSSQAGLYTGPATAWHAQIKGSPAAVVSCFLTLPQEVSVQPGAFSILSDQMTLWFSVVGRPSIGLTP